MSPHTGTGTGTGSGGTDPTSLPADKESATIERSSHTSEGKSLPPDNKDQGSIQTQSVALAAHPNTSGCPLGPEFLPSSVAFSARALVAKLQWATGELAGSSSVEQSIQLCHLIKACADALHSLKTLETTQSTHS